ncbi:F0F1 ATP synthase subunit B' [Maricaulaceae bacterium EIL42A08]|nr:F0F1 ATP synthase subunit B' [Maricaulaceae bacterium EIL42A08]MCP2680220.1 F0F1 ATP synthase subunit B' [Maricaulaceae bacterium NA33B04]
MAIEAPGEGAEYAAEAAFPPFDPTYFASQLFWLAISFALLYFVLSRLILPRIGGAIEERKDKIADNLDAAADMKSQADETVEAYEKELAEARTRAQAVAAEAKAEVDKEIAEATRQADTELEAKLVESEKRIQAAREAALADVKTIASEAAAAAAEHLAGLDVSEADAAKAVDAARG